MADLGLLKKKKKFLEDNRTTYESLWRDLSDFIAPDRGVFCGETPGQERSDRYKKLVDPTASISLDYFAAGMQAGLNSPKRPWFRLQTNDPDLNKSDVVKEYFSSVERVIYDILGKSNFYTGTHNIYLEEGGFGSGCLLMEEDWNKVVRFNALTVGEYWLDVGTDGKVDTLYRELYMPVRNIVARWGMDRVSPAVQGMYEARNHFRLVKVIHMIEPRKDRDVRMIDARNMPYSSIYYEEGSDHILGESGFVEKPMACPRWSVVGSAVYGSGPGQKVLRQIKMLQELNLTKLRVEHLNADPPVIGPESLRTKGMNTLPGGKTYADSDKLAQFGPLFKVDYNPAGAIEGINDVRRIIERCLYTDLFIMLVEKDDMTATEILERKQEKLFTLGPAIEKQTDELLDPVIDFTYTAAAKRGLLPPAPPELQGQDLDIQFISSLAQAQKLAGLDQTRAYVSVGIELATVNPEAVDKLDIDAIMDEVADITGVPPKCNRSADEVAAIREQRAQQQQAAIADEQANMTAQRMKDLSGATLDGNNALTELQRSLEG